jgi:hypothetical protein
MPLTAAVAAPKPGPGSPATVTLNGGGTLPGGTYRVTVRVGGRNRTALIVVPKPPVREPPVKPPGTGKPAPGRGAGATKGADSGGAASTGAAGSGSPGHALLILAVILGVALLGLGGYFTHTRILVPHRRRVSYRQAVQAVTEGRYAQALPRLSRLEGVLAPDRQAEVRFFIAFSLFQLDELEEAEIRLAALNREHPGDRDVAYLLAYLRVKRGDVNAAEPVLTGLDDGELRRDSALRKLYGVVEFHRAMAAFRAGSIDVAADLFATVESLGDFRQHIPADLRNRHVVLGTQALFEKDVLEARGQFERLEQSAADMGPPARDELLAVAKLGLALALWVEDAPQLDELEGLLAGAARLLDPAGELSMAWPESTDDLADRLTGLAGDQPPPVEATGADRVLRDIHFLRAAAVLRSWAAADGPAGDERNYPADVLARLACARARDPEFSDTYLVAGMLRYHLADDDAERLGAIAVLREAQKRGARDPEVLRVFDQDKRSRRAARDAIEAYLQELDRYVRDATVRDQVRAALLERRSRYGKVLDLDSRPGIIRIRAAQPTVAEMNDRSQLLTERVRQLLATYPDGGDLGGAYELIQSLEQTGQALSEQARSVEEKEAALLALIGDRLLPGQ